MANSYGQLSSLLKQVFGQEVRVFRQEHSSDIVIRFTKVDKCRYCGIETDQEKCPGCGASHV